MYQIIVQLSYWSIFPLFSVIMAQFNIPNKDLRINPTLKDSDLNYSNGTLYTIGSLIVILIVLNQFFNIILSGLSVIDL